MKYRIWDRKEKINNVDAEYIINSLSIRETDGVFYGNLFSYANTKGKSILYSNSRKIPTVQRRYRLNINNRRTRGLNKIISFLWLD